MSPATPVTPQYLLVMPAPALTPAATRKALAHLRTADPVMADVITRVGRCAYVVHPEGTHFHAVCRSIIYQQLSGSAAATIHGRVRALFGGRDPAPAELAVTPDEALRSVGLSRQKLRYLKDLATHAGDGSLPIETLHTLPDDEVISSLTRVRGVGTWTAQMFLMFRLGRPDVLPVLDLGIRKAVQRAYRMRKLPPPERVAKVGARWAPYRTVASWYLWRSLDSAGGDLNPS